MDGDDDEDGAIVVWCLGDTVQALPQSAARNGLANNPQVRMYRHREAMPLDALGSGMGLYNPEGPVLESSLERS